MSYHHLYYPLCKYRYTNGRLCGYSKSQHGFDKYHKVHDHIYTRNERVDFAYFAVDSRRNIVAVGSMKEVIASLKSAPYTPDEISIHKVMYKRGWFGTELVDVNDYSTARVIRHWRNVE